MCRGYPRGTICLHSARTREPARFVTAPPGAAGNQQIRMETTANRGLSPIVICESCPREDAGEASLRARQWRTARVANDLCRRQMKPRRRALSHGAQRRASRSSAVSTTARVPSRQGLRNAYMTHPSHSSVTLSRAIGGQLLALSHSGKVAPKPGDPERSRSRPWHPRVGAERVEAATEVVRRRGGIRVGGVVTETHFIARTRTWRRRRIDRSAPPLRCTKVTGLTSPVWASLTLDRPSCRNSVVKQLAAAAPSSVRRQTPQ